MPRNFPELKGGGGTIPMLSPHPEKWGGGRVPPVPHRSTPVYMFAPECMHGYTTCTLTYACEHDIYTHKRSCTRAHALTYRYLCPQQDELPHSGGAAAMWRDGGAG